MRRPGRCQAIGDVVFTQQAAADRVCLVIHHNVKMQSVRAVLNVGGKNVSLWIFCAVGDDVHLCYGSQIFIRAVVHVQHCQTRVANSLFLRGFQAGEQFCFGFPVRLIRPMVVEMFVGDIGDHADVKLAVCHPVLLKTMRGGLQHHVGQASRLHAREITLHLGRFRGGNVEARINHLIADGGIDGGDHTDQQTGFE